MLALKNQKKKFRLFDMNRDGKGAVAESRKPTFGFFFKSLFRKFPQLLRLNVLMIFQALPIIFIVVAFLAGKKTPTTTNVTFAPLLGIDLSLSTPEVTTGLDMSSIQMGLPVFSIAVNVTIVILFLFLFVTWGWQNVGSTYVLRGLFRGDPVFVFTDYFYGIKKNLKQGFLFGLIDISFIAVLVIDFIFFYQQTGKAFGTDFMYFVIFALAIIYFIMRFFVYLLIITFDMKNFKVIKNSFIFSILGIKRNILALLGIVLLIALHIFITIYLITGPFGFVIILPLVYIFATTAFMACYAAYPTIDKYLIVPYTKPENTDDFVYLKPADAEQDRDANITQ